MIIGYTTGVFDMFHVGHLRILEQAKAQCDHLIVGVSTDELVQSYKNKSPVISEHDRMKIISSIRYVDKVVPQTSREKMRAYNTYKFDIMFVGDDWKGNALFQQTERELNALGAKIIYFPYTKHVSSTKLHQVLEDIQNLGRDF
ncbi:adenylyltransferase/cytidyltransferase family protein [Planktotalea arctica]|uniref:adenylyltransferase/cytidyltransferase family protein n=1 Tax=Planktotalea arctica TaxID=1481893 RepID=UPI00321BBCDB